ncbi:hypothetical protein CK203_104447 [Vitis vinifera]|uniref:DUF4216 domain-containing protein n=1 Tax=Vitis vinifera TaxID=29760 RepID=A0A438DH14_VITVI|nr:hypothetical protein CK203_104447 [Vitis vinifera]
MFTIPIFKCDWVDNKNGIRVDDLRFTLVDFNKMAHKSDHFILASQAKQVFYVIDFSTPQQDFLEMDEGDDLMDNSIEHHQIISSLPQIESLDAMDDFDAICVLARTMVLIRYNSWIKNNLWDTIEASFTLDSKSRRNCMLMMGKCFQSFKNMLTIKYVIPFKDQPKDFGEVKKERRKKHIYNHHLSRKGYAGLEDEMPNFLSSNIKQKQIVLPQVIEQPKYEVDGHVPRVQKANKVRKWQLAIFRGLDYFFFRTKENVVAAGTIILECGVNFLVVVDASYEPNAPLLVHIPTKLQLLERLLGIKFCGLPKWSVLLLIPSRTICFCKSKAGIREANKESRSRVIANQLMNANHPEFIFIPYNPVYHWVLVALYIRTMIAYYLDSLQDQPSDDLKKIVNM